MANDAQFELDKIEAALSAALTSSDQLDDSLLSALIGQALDCVRARIDGSTHAAPQCGTRPPSS